MNIEGFIEGISQLPKMEIKQMQQITSAGNSSVKCLISKVLKHFNILYFLFSILDPWFNNLKRKKCFISA